MTKSVRNPKWKDRKPQQELYTPGTLYASRRSLLRGDSPTLLIFTGTLEECHAIVQEHDIQSWAFLRGPIQLRRHGPLSRVLISGTVKDRPDFKLLMKEIAKRKMLVDNYGGIAPQEVPSYEGRKKPGPKPRPPKDENEPPDYSHLGPLDQPVRRLKMDVVFEGVDIQKLLDEGDKS